MSKLINDQIVEEYEKKKKIDRVKLIERISNLKKAHHASGTKSIEFSLLHKKLTMGLWGKMFRYLLLVSFLLKDRMSDDTRAERTHNLFNLNKNRIEQKGDLINDKGGRSKEKAITSWVSSKGVYMFR